MRFNQYSIRTLLAVIFITLSLGACDKGEDKTPSANTSAPTLQKVLTIHAEKRVIQPKFEFPAVIEATQTASVRAQVAASVVASYSKPGALVKKGDLLVELDDSEYIAALAEANAALQEAEANASQAATNFERAKKLKPAGHISDQDYDQIKATVDATKAQIARLKASQVRAELDMKYTKIYAPFSGRISNATFSVGDFVMPASPVQPQPLFEIVKLDPIYAVAYIDLSIYDNFVLKRLELKQQGIEIPPLQLGIKLLNGTPYPYTGEFENWDNKAAQASGSIAARVLFDNPDGLLLPGHNVTITGEVIDKLDRIMVPQKAVMMDQQGHYVFVIEAAGVARKNITVGIRDGKDWSIPVGLEPGDEVIVEGIQKVRPGDKVDAQAYQG